MNPSWVEPSPLVYEGSLGIRKRPVQQGSNPPTRSNATHEKHGTACARAYIVSYHSSLLKIPPNPHLIQSYSADTVASSSLTYNTIRFLHEVSNKFPPHLPLQRLRSRLYPIGSINATHQTVQILRTAPPGEHVRANPKSYPTLKNTCLRLLPSQSRCSLAHIPHP